MNAPVWWKDFLAGYSSGLVGLAIGNPLDVLKVRLQEQSSQGSSPVGRQAPTTSNGVRNLYREGGVGQGILGHATLFLGVSAPMLGLAFLNGILFTSYGYLLKLQRTDRKSTSDLAAIFLAGTGAGLACVFVSTPIELIKCREQGIRSSLSAANASRSIPPAVASTLQTVKSIYMAEGLRGFYVATLTTGMRDSIGYGFYFAGYEGMRQSLGGTSDTDGPWLSASKILLAGGVGGVISWTSVYPLDSIKTILQSSNAELRPSSAWTVAKDIWRTGGIAAFYCGLWPTIIRALLVNAVTFFTYESVMNALVASRKTV